MKVRTAAVLAGGLGTRVASLTGGILPKALLPVAGRPFLDHKLAELRDAGVGHVVLLLGTHAERVVEHIEQGRNWGLTVTCVTDGDRLLGTGGAIAHAIDLLPERFWVTYGDTLLRADLVDAENLAAERGWPAVMTVLRNQDRWQRSNVSLEGDLVIGYDKGAAEGMHEFIDYGLLYFRSDCFKVRREVPFDLDIVIRELIDGHALGAFEVAEPFHDIGTPEALVETERWLVCRTPL